jgi:hypothetical protein
MFTLHVLAYMAIFRCVRYFPFFFFSFFNPTDNKESEKTKHAHMKMEINEIATKKHKLETV